MIEAQYLPRSTYPLEFLERDQALASLPMFVDSLAPSKTEFLNNPTGNDAVGSHIDYPDNVGMLTLLQIKTNHPLYVLFHIVCSTSALGFPVATDSAWGCGIETELLDV